MKAVIEVRLYDESNTHCVAKYYRGVGHKLVSELDKARTFSNVGHAKNSISFGASDVAWRLRHGNLGEETGAKLARFFVVPVRLKLVQTDEPEEYTP